MARLREIYRDHVAPELAEELSIRNPMAIPKLTKIVVSMGLGRAIQDKKILDAAQRDLGLVTGQKPVVCHARKSVSNFKLREGMPIGCKVTLRQDRMYEFLDRLINAAIPRLRDFRGLSGTFDGSGNYSLGLSEQTIFSEINLDDVEHTLGMNITFVTTARSDEHGKALLTKLGMPFRRSEASKN